MIEEAFVDAATVLEKCSTKHGFFAAYPGYDMVFARDAMIISLGALLFPKFYSVIEESLITLAKNQSPHGQIPNAVDKFSSRKDRVDYLSIDSTLWFLLIHQAYKKKTDDTLFNQHRKNIAAALNWLSYQDITETSLLVQQPTTDWQDAFPHRYGHTINTQALWYKVLTLYNRRVDAQKVYDAVNNNADLQLWDKNFYLAYRWKNHGKYQEKSDWFDTLGNILAILFDLADENRAKKILDYIEKNEINKPCPIKAIFPPITKNSPHWQDYYLDCAAGKPYNYLNGGIWTFIGGLYVLALIKYDKMKEAELHLQKLAQANVKYKFTEWLHGKTGKEGETEAKIKSVQGWNAAMYMLAYESFKQKKLLFV